MVGHDGAVEPAFVVELQRLRHVDVAVVDEDLVVGREASRGVAEMDIADLAARGEVLDHLIDVDVAHRRDGALAELEAVGRRVDEVHQLLHALEGGERTEGPLQVFDRRVVRMGAHLHAVLLRHGTEGLEEVLEPRPVLLGRRRRQHVHGAPALDLGVEPEPAGR